MKSRVSGEIARPNATSTGLLAEIAQQRPQDAVVNKQPLMMGGSGETVDLLVSKIRAQQQQREQNDPHAQAPPLRINIKTQGHQMGSLNTPISPQALTQLKKLKQKFSS